MPFDQGHALLIGVGTYAHAPQLDVPISATDAKALAEVLGDPACCGYLEGRVQVLHDAGASRAGILAALDTLAAQVGPEDTVLFFYCGHGDRGTDGDYCLTTHDCRLEQGALASDSALRQGEPIERLRAIKAKRLLVLVNSCYSGELSPTLGAEPPALSGKPLPGQAAEALLATGEGRVVIAACRESQMSYIGKGSLSLFTQALVDGLRGKGISSNRGFVSAYDLYSQVYFQVSEEVQGRYGLTQEPELTVLKGVGPFAVSLYPGATSLGSFDGTAPAPAGTAAREVSPAKAQVMLDQLVRNSYRATLEGSGAIAQGPGAVAVGERGVQVRGSNSGTIVTGTQIDNRIDSHIDTGGGAYVGGSVDTGGGDFIGRDRKGP